MVNNASEFAQEKSEKALNQTGAHVRLNKIQDSYRSYFRITFDELGLASRQQTQELQSWVFGVRANDQEQLHELEKWWKLDYSKRINVAYALDDTFRSQLSMAINEKLISRNSAQRWEERFRNRNVAYKEKEQWVLKEMPNFLKRWKEVAEEREKLIRDADAIAALKSDPVFSILWEQEAFLDLHYEKRRSLVDEAYAAIEASKSKNGILFKDANRMLEGAALRGYLSREKIGMWLRRIFQSGSSNQTMQEFVYGNSAQSLTSLIQNWKEVKERYDHIRSKIREHGQSDPARGLHLLSESQFLKLHYESRLKYVQEAEQRLGEAKNVNEELPVFLEIRHAMDTHDWEEADTLILKARAMGLSNQERQRLNSMDSFVKQFTGRKESTESMSGVTEARARIDQIVTEMASSHPELQSMVMRLLRGPNANRSLHQFRWIVYNNKWCRTHGYLNDTIARKGASKENKELTKERKRQGMDIGRNDVLDGDTAGGDFIRKDEYANHKATLLHVNVSDGAASGAVAEKMEKEQDSRVLYWMTFCGIDSNGDPKSDNWHNDLFFLLTELRGASKTLKNAGFSYGGPGQPLVGLN